MIAAATEAELPPSLHVILRCPFPGEELEDLVPISDTRGVAHQPAQIVRIVTRQGSEAPPGVSAEFEHRGPVRGPIAGHGLSPGSRVEPGCRYDDRPGCHDRSRPDWSQPLPVVLASLLRCPDERVGTIDLGHAFEVGRCAIRMVLARQGAIGSRQNEPLGAWIDLENLVCVEFSEQGPMNAWPMLAGTPREVTTA